jgi:hypothetical protein
MMGSGIRGESAMDGHRCSGPAREGDVAASLRNDGGRTAYPVCISGGKRAWVGSGRWPGRLQGRHQGRYQGRYPGRYNVASMYCKYGGNPYAIQGISR